MFKWVKQLFNGNAVEAVKGNPDVGYTVVRKNGYSSWSSSKSVLLAEEQQRDEEIAAGRGEWINGNYYRK